MNLRAKRIISALLIISASVTGYEMMDGEIEFRSGKYGLAEIKVMDLVFSVNDAYDDGPYVLLESGVLIDKSISAGKVIVSKSKFSLQELQFSNEDSEYQNVSKIAALSDIHGQHDVFINILRNNNIIAQNDDWAFGAGHLVITGDIFDRGPQVLDSLWFLFNLEKQAATAGGKVHYLLGNHEYMVLQGNEIYLHDNYEKTAELLGESYHNLFNKNSLLGAWLRSKATIIKINDTLFVHGGLSESFVSNKLSLDMINQRYRDSIDMTKSDIKESINYKILHDSVSPIWYRGYFYDELSTNEIKSILQQANANRIVVGHTSTYKVTRLFNGMLFAVDTSIKKGKSGEILMIENEIASRRTYDGVKELF